jgi:hypothetical protein
VKHYFMPRVERVVFEILPRIPSHILYGLLSEDLHLIARQCTTSDSRSTYHSGGTFCSPSDTVQAKISVLNLIFAGLDVPSFRVGHLNI